ncbi:MAG TPA: hypothetical protein V6C81_23515 [Planktothrix sp.]|jgi:hypothetical protein
MVSTPGSTKLMLVSNPYTRRVGLFPLIIAISAGWVFVFLWSAVTAYAFWYNNYWAVVLLASTLAFASFLTYMSYSLVRDAFQEYTFELTDSEAILTVLDKLKHKKSMFMILLDDVKYAEYYPYSDSSCIILKAPYYEMEVPLWPLGERAQDVIDFLSGRGIRIVNVQSDDPIPEVRQNIPH